MNNQDNQDLSEKGGGRYTLEKLKEMSNLMIFESDEMLRLRLRLTNKELHDEPEKAKEGKE